MFVCGIDLALKVLIKLNFIRVNFTRDVVEFDFARGSNSSLFVLFSLWSQLSCFSLVFKSFRTRWGKVNFSCPFPAQNFKLLVLESIKLYQRLGFCMV